MPLLVYVTCPDSKVAEDISRKAISERLAACANIFPEIVSIYEWEGKVQKDKEIALILKTQEKHLNDLTTLIQANHPYDCPCVVGVPLKGGNNEFFDWIKNQTD